MSYMTLLAYLVASHGGLKMDLISKIPSESAVSPNCLNYCCSKKAAFTSAPLSTRQTPCNHVKVWISPTRHEGKHTCIQCCGAALFLYGSGSDPKKKYIPQRKKSGSDFCPKMHHEQTPSKKMSPDPTLIKR